MEWNRNLQGYLGIADIWEVLNGEEPEPAGRAEKKLWDGYQRKLQSLLLLICGPLALSIIALHSDKTATEQYKALKRMYSTTTTTTYSTLYRRIFKCSLSNHKSLKDYGQEVANARNKLIELGMPMSELEVSCAFLDGLDTSYQAWKDVFLGIYAKNPTKIDNGKEVLIVPTIEEVLDLLIDREPSSLASSPKPSTTRAYGAKGRDK